ncbi:MAG: hypothetical protein KKG59_00635 [Nanoarchaeota archaeon]|nr:hypothetical protein [Nanoarchaeota archaeon]
MKKEHKDRTLFWLPRGLVLLFILFLAVFGFDVFGSGQGFWWDLLGFIIHLMPVWMLAIILVVSWRRPLVGGIGFVAMALIFWILFDPSPPAMIFLIFPQLVVAILYFLEWKLVENLV